MLNLYESFCIIHRRPKTHQIHMFNIYYTQLFKLLFVLIFGKSYFNLEPFQEHYYLNGLRNYVSFINKLYEQ